MNDRLLEIVGSLKHNTLHNYITPGLQSHLLATNTNGGLVRLFESTRETTEFITPHSHRFNFAAVVLAGEVTNIIYRPMDSGVGEEWCTSTVDQVCGADGIRQYTHTRDSGPSWFEEEVSFYSPGDRYYMDVSEIHTINFSRGAQVLFIEGPQLTTTGHMLEPWVNGKLVPTFRTEPWMFER